MNLVDPVGGACCNWGVGGESAHVGVHHPKSHPDVLHQGPAFSQWGCWRTSRSTGLVAKVFHCIVPSGISTLWMSFCFNHLNIFWLIYVLPNKGIPSLAKVSRLRRLMKRSAASKYRKLTDIKAGARLLGWNFVPGSKLGGQAVAWFTFRIIVQFPIDVNISYVYNHCGSDLNMKIFDNFLYVKAIYDTIYMYTHVYIYIHTCMWLIMCIYIYTLKIHLQLHQF